MKKEICAAVVLSFALSGCGLYIGTTPQNTAIQDYSTATNTATNTTSSIPASAPTTQPSTPTTPQMQQEPITWNNGQSFGTVSVPQGWTMAPNYGSDGSGVDSWISPNQNEKLVFELASAYGANRDTNGNFSPSTALPQGTSIQSQSLNKYFFSGQSNGKPITGYVFTSNDAKGAVVVYATGPQSDSSLLPQLVNGVTLKSSNPADLLGPAQ